MTETGLYIAIAYVAVFVFGSLGFALWRIKRRNTRPPLETKLLRGPGETLRKRMADYDENLLFRLLGASLVPLTPVLVVGWAIVQFGAHAGLPVWVWYSILSSFLQLCFPRFAGSGVTWTSIGTTASAISASASSARS